MKRKFALFYVLSTIGMLLASYYPIYMGYKVVKDIRLFGTVLEENYPKYIIPYTPISIALIIGVLLMPLIIKIAKRFAFLLASGISLSVFFIAEFILESKVIVTSTVETSLESWQMAACYLPPTDVITSEVKKLTAVEVLMGEYSPEWKIHFYVISVILILIILNCFYGFAQYIKNGKTDRLKSLIIQAVLAMIFLGLCIFACFTAFFRDGQIRVEPISAILMVAFFILMGVCAGVLIGSFLSGKKKIFSVGIPSLMSGIITLVMYIGEMILLSGHLYRFGEGFFFEPLGTLGMAPADLLIIVMSMVTAGFIMTLTERRN